LSRRAAFLGGTTERLFRAAGLEPGMRVLGAALETARGRAQSLGLRHGMQMRMGRQLFGAFLGAGLPAPDMRDEALVGGGPDFGGYAWLAGVARSLAPLMAKLAIADVDQLELGTLPDRIRDDAVAAGVVVWTPSFVGAYTRTPER
jgi:hypothetical protein